MHALTKKEKDKLKAQLGSSRCTAISSKRHLDYLIQSLAQIGVEISYLDHVDRQHVHTLCSLHGIPTNQTSASHPDLQCQMEAMLGGDTCTRHTPPASRAVIRRQLQTLMYPAIERARKIINDSQQHGAVVSLIKHVFDVNGYKPTDKLEVDDKRGTGLPSGMDISKLSNDQLREFIAMIRLMRNEGRVMKAEVVQISEGKRSDVMDVESTEVEAANVE